VPALILGFIAAASGATDQWFKDTEARREALVGASLGYPKTNEDRIQAMVNWFHDRGPWQLPAAGDHFIVERFKDYPGWPSSLVCRGWLKSRKELPPDGKPGDFYRIVGNPHIFVWPLPPYSGWVDP
jgi:hypothetical protein